MGIDIDKINTYKIRSKLNIIKCRPIYEVIEEAYFTESEFFSDDFKQQCKENANEAQFISLKIKNKMNRMAMKQGLYAQVDMLRWKYLIFTNANKNKNKSKFRFQGQSARS